MTLLKNDRLLKALLCQPVDCTPIWIMRQAGRYLPEYREIRNKAGSFMALCQNPKLACEVTMQPLRRFHLDAAILFSDILTIPHAMNLGLVFEPGKGPCFQRPIRTEKDVNILPIPSVQNELSYVIEAIEIIQHELNGEVPLIGFAGSPWTIATYMVEGRSSKDFRHIKAMMYNSPALLHQLLTLLADSIIDYLNGQIKAGVQIVQIFDTWGGILSPLCYNNFSLCYMKRIINGLIKEHAGNKIPVILFTKNGDRWLELMVDTGADALGIDWIADIANARMRVGQRVALQGNLDPSVLYASNDFIREEVQRLLADFGEGSGHVFNLGHGIHPFVSPDKVAVLVNAVHEFSAAYH